MTSIRAKNATGVHLTTLESIKMREGCPEQDYHFPPKARRGIKNASECVRVVSLDAESAQSAIGVHRAENDFLEHGERKRHKTR